jgi:cytidylate kinase
MPTRVVTISSATGAGGDVIGRMVAERLGFQYIDEQIIAAAAEKEGVDAALVADAERRRRFLGRLLSGLAEKSAHVTVAAGELLSTDRFAPARSEAMRTLIVAAINETAERGDVVIGSHAASIPLAGRMYVLRVLVTASSDTRVGRVAKSGQHGSGDAARFIRENDAGRAAYFKRFYGIDEELPTHYDLVVNTDALTPDEATDIIAAAARRRG